MPRHITILGTSHDLQGAEKRKSSVNDPTFSEAIEFLLSGKDFVFEEASGCGPTIAEKGAHEKLGPGHYLDVDLSLPKMLSGANAFEISDIERMNIGAHQPGVWHVTMLHALWLREITIRQGQAQVVRQIKC